LTLLLNTASSALTEASAGSRPVAGGKQEVIPSQTG
jgi:hypothetical protein